MKLTIEIPDDKVDDVIDAMCEHYAFDGVEKDKPAFAKAQLLEHIRQIYKTNKADKAAKETRENTTL